MAAVKGRHADKMQIPLFKEENGEKLLNDLFLAYFDARRNKRNTISALAFEKHFESNLFELHEEIISRTYEPRKSICFIVDKPVKREIFAANFRDRVVHHLLYNYTAPVFEKTFINDSYSCRKGKGTHYGIKRIDHFIRSCSENYSKDCYILKLDIRGYFMAMNRLLLFEKVKSALFAAAGRADFDLSLVLYLFKKTIFNDPTQNCAIKGSKEDWQGLPRDKSLFHAMPDCGLPIGNLTSQLFGNVYLNDLDHYIKRDLRIKYYGRYVDDFVLIHRNKAYLKAIIPVIRALLHSRMHLQLHAGKIYLQHFSKGVTYLGAVVLPHRMYIGSRTKGNFYAAVQTQNQIARSRKPARDEQEKFISCMNSYLGIFKHYKTYHLRRKVIFNDLSGWWWNLAGLNSPGIFVLKQRQVCRHGFFC